VFIVASNSSKSIFVAILVEILDAPPPVAIAVLVDRHLLVEWIAYQHIIEAFTALYPRTFGRMILGGCHFLEASRLVREELSSSP
jgi:hypothetical protein